MPMPRMMAQRTRNPNHLGSTATAKHTKPDAVMVLHQAKIKAILDACNAGRSGGKQYMGMYPAALSEVMKSLTDEELKAAEDTTSKWNKDGAPAELQQKYVLAYLI
jgi:hypothetical protein